MAAKNSGKADKGAKIDKDEDASPPSLDKQVMRDVLDRKIPLMVTAQAAQDIMSALRLKQEFEIDIVIDGAAEAYLLLDELRDAGVKVILHPTMGRQYGELQNASFTTASVLREAGIPFALQSGYEAYVPKTRVVLWEAAIAAAADAARLFVIGGAQLYASLLPQADRLVLTEVWADVEGDARFPMLDRDDFVEERRDPRQADADNDFDFDFVEYRRR